MAPLAQLVAGAVHPLGAIVEAYRSGEGVPFADYGADLREGQARVNRASFLQLIGSEWLPAMPDVHARLRSQPPARVADLGCGAGWSCIGTARSYPEVQVDGFDLDTASESSRSCPSTTSSSASTACGNRATPAIVRAGRERITGEC